ncbi:MAG: hypothetical protein IPJ82_10700 [Lewinellaceae bacterium]|nr:hypothetical protein [Lewinellaceae bacterium]
MEENEAYRSNQIARNIEFMRLPWKEDRYMNGLILAYQVSAVVPRALNPAKLETKKALAPEAIILLFYGRKGFDLADNFPLYGYLEFGNAGAFFAGLLQGFILIAFEWFAFRFQRIHPFLGLSMLTFVLYNHLNMEYPYQQELSILRELIIFFLLAWPVAAVSKLIARRARKGKAGLQRETN